jgi:biotin carboxyl carrier protein
METALAAPVSGVIKSVHVEDGSQVSAGDLVVEIES